MATQNLYRHSRCWHNLYRHNLSSPSIQSLTRQHAKETGKLAFSGGKSGWNWLKFSWDNPSPLAHDFPGQGTEDDPGMQRSALPSLATSLCNPENYMLRAVTNYMLANKVWKIWCDGKQFHIQWKGCVGKSCVSKGCVGEHPVSQCTVPGRIVSNCRDTTRGHPGCVMNRHWHRLLKRG